MDKLFSNTEEKSVSDLLYTPDTLFIPDSFEDGTETSDISSDVLANISKVMAHNIDKDILKANTCHYREFVSQIIPSHSYQWTHYANIIFDLGYYGRHDKMHDVIIGCHNIIGRHTGKHNERVYIELWVPIADILDIEDPAVIEYAKLYNSYGFEKVFRFQVSKEFDSINYRKALENGIYWTQFTMSLSRSEFIW